MDEIIPITLKVKKFKIECEGGIEIYCDSASVAMLGIYKNGYPLNGAYGFTLSGSYDDDKPMTVEVNISSNLLHYTWKYKNIRNRL